MNGTKKEAVKEGFEICLQASKDWLAHKKFLKESGLECDGEARRTGYPRGPAGWVQWRAQFALAPGEDLSLVGNSLKALRERNKLSQDETERLRKLYGLDRTMPRPEFCSNCGKPVDSDAEFCSECGATTK